MLACFRQFFSDKRLPQYGQPVYVNIDRIAFVCISQARVLDAGNVDWPFMDRPLVPYTLICFSGQENDHIAVCEDIEAVARVIDTLTPERT